MTKTKPKTKKTSSQKAKRRDRIRPGKDPKAPDLLAYTADIEFHEISEGRHICRQDLLSNKFNKAGLSLQAINCELDYAFESEGDFELLMDQFARESGPDRDYHLRLDPTPGDSIIEKSCSDPTPDHLVQPDDARLAKLIRAAPLALLRSFDAQDALARWTYAVRHCHHPETRASAKKLLGTALPPKGRGPRGKAGPDLPQLLQAYDDLCCYVKLLYACAEVQARRHPTKADARTPEAVADGVRKLLEHFPDAEALRDSGVVLEEIVRPEIKGQAASDVAAAYIARRHGLSSSRVMDIVAKARVGQTGPRT